MRIKLLVILILTVLTSFLFYSKTLAADGWSSCDASVFCPSQTDSCTKYKVSGCDTYSTSCSCLPANSCSCPAGNKIVCCTEGYTTTKYYCNGVYSGGSGASGYYVGCYANSSSCSCCTPNCGTCDDFPSCPKGYTADDTATACREPDAKKVYCDNPGTSCTTAGCGKSSQTCYLLETNLQFVQSNGSTSGPATVSMIIDEKKYDLSTDPSNPTHIKLPAKGSSNVQITTPTFVAPDTSRGANYYYQANNYGVNNEWEPWISCNSAEDFCTIMPNSNNTQDLVPTSKTIDQVFKEGATGEISAMYATTDKCTDTYKYSLPTKGYYVVDYIPDPPTPCTPGDPTCTWIPEIKTNVTQRGCSSLTYSGTEVNNELHINAGVTDTDNLNEIQAFTLWFSKDTNVPAVGSIAASYTGSVTSDVGIMIRKNGNTWDNPNVYATNATLTWGQISLNNGEGYINIAGTNIIKISDVTVVPGANITFDYKIQFLNNDSNLSGMYNVYGGSLDTHMINTDKNILDQSYFYKFFNWGIDLVRPTVEEVTQQIVDPKNTYITWSNADVTSGIGRTVINAYRLGGVSTDPEGVKLLLPTAYTTLLGAITLDPNAQIPSDSEIGLYNDANAWKFNNNLGEKDLVNVGNNESGKIALYVTAYDKACNTSGTTEEIDLNPWFATRGATVYSQGNISSTAKEVAGLAYLDGVFNPKTGMNSNLIDLGTELLSTRNLTISTLLHSGSGAVMATNVEDSNNTQNVWYNKLLKKLNQYKPELEQLTSVSDTCDTGKCYYYSLEDITIPSGYTCNAQILFITEKDIHIRPDVQSNNSVLSGCIFVAKNNIYVDAGIFKSTGTKVMYDYIEGYLIADNQIIFPVADETQTLRDGVEIFGGMVAMGTNASQGVSIQRNLRLFSQINPTVVLTYDNKYSSISTAFFGTEYNLYKQEVGFKTF